MRVCWCGGVHDLTFKGFDCLPVAPLLGSFLRQAQAWLEASVTIKAGEVSSFRDYFSGFFVLLVDGRRDSKRGSSGNFSTQSGVSCCCPSPQSCAHTARLTAQAGGLQLIQRVWAARLIPLRSSKPRGAPLTLAVWPRWFRRMMNSREN